MTFSQKQFNQLWQRAWQSVRDIEVFEYFIDELKDMHHIPARNLSGEDKGTLMRELEQAAQRSTINYELLAQYTTDTIDDVILTIRRPRKSGQQKIYIVPIWNAKEPVSLRTTEKFLKVRYHIDWGKDIYTAARESIQRLEMHEGKREWANTDDTLEVFRVGSHLCACPYGKRAATTEDIELMQKKFSDWGIESVVEER